MQHAKVQYDEKKKKGKSLGGLDCKIQKLKVKRAVEKQCNKR